MTFLTWADRIAAATALSTPRQVGAVPVVYPLLEELRVRETINALCQTRAEIDLGRLVEVRTLNRLMAPQPLYRVGEWATRTVVASMFGLAAAPAQVTSIAQQSAGLRRREQVPGTSHCHILTWRRKGFWGILIEGAKTTQSHET